MKGFRFALFLATVLCLTAFAAAFTSMYCPGGTPRGCEDRQDSVSAARLPDSLRVTLQQKLESDTGLVFWGVQKDFKTLAYMKFHHGLAQSWSHEAITQEQEREFFAWYNEQENAIRSKMDSVPEDLRQAFMDAIGKTIYALVETEYRIKKVYDRKSRSWVNPREGEETLTRHFLAHIGPVIETNPPRLLAEIGLEYVDTKAERIFFEDGHSRVIDEDEFKSLDLYLKKDGYYLPNHYRIEISKDMSPVYKQGIVNAIGAGDKEAVRANMAALDTFLVYANGRFFYSAPSPVSCDTKRLLSVYLQTFEDNMECDADRDRGNSEGDRVIRSLAIDSARAMLKSGELERLLAGFSASDRAFWRVVVSSLSIKDQDKLNELVEANADSIKKIEQRNFVTKLYSGVGIGITIQMGMGFGETFGLGDTYHYIEHPFTFDITLEFFYNRFGGGYNGRFLSSKKFDGDKFQSLYLLDIYAGYRTFSLSHLENFVYVGPTIIFSDLMEKDNQEPLESSVGVGFHFGTAFDFYFTRYSKRGQLRLGLRLFASVSNYYTDVVKGSDGGTVSVTLTPLLQYYENRDTKYGER